MRRNFQLITQLQIDPLEKLAGIPKLTKDQRTQVFREVFREKYDTDPEHVAMRRQRWSFIKLKAHDMLNLDLKPGKQEFNNTLRKIEQWRQELLDKPSTTIQPLQIAGSHQKPVHEILKDNIILDTGLGKAAERDTGDSGEVTTPYGVNKVRLGGSSAAEDAGNAGVLSPLGNYKAYDTSGNRSVPTGSKTGKYIMTFYADTDGFTGLPNNINEAGQYSESLVAHSRLKLLTTITLNSGEALLSQINEINSNG